MRAAWTGVVVLGLGSVAFAQEEGADEERYLLGDHGVRVDLPEGWGPLAWSDASFEAEAEDRSVKLFVWGGGTQVTPRVEDIDAWARTFIEKAESIEGKDVTVLGKEVRTIAGRTTARVELTFELGAGLKGAMSGATFAAEGTMVHLATIAAERRSTLGHEALDVMLGRLELKKPPADAPDGQVVTAGGVSGKLPPGWRPPIGKEAGYVDRAAGKLGVELSDRCFSALHPRANAEPDVLLSCPGGLLLGVVDAFSFEGVDAEIRSHVFGTAPVPAATQLTAASGQTGFLYRPELGGRTLAMAVVPFGEGVSRTWMLGAEGQAEAFAQGLTTFVSGATFEGDHPAGLGDEVRYYLTYRPTSPVTLGAVGGVLVVGALLVMLVMRSVTASKRRYEDV